MGICSSINLRLVSLKFIERLTKLKLIVYFITGPDSKQLWPRRPIKLKRARKKNACMKAENSLKMETLLKFKLYQRNFHSARFLFKQKEILTRKLSHSLTCKHLCKYSEDRQTSVILTWSYDHNLNNVFIVIGPLYSVNYLIQALAPASATKSSRLLVTRWDILVYNIQVSRPLRSDWAETTPINCSLMLARCLSCCSGSCATSSSPPFSLFSSSTGKSSAFRFRDAAGSPKSRDTAFDFSM